jgi:hypothetical protein
VGVTSSRLVAVHCRINAWHGYDFRVEPDRRHFTLVRSDGTDKPQVFLVDWTPTPIINNGNNWNHLEITRNGDTIAASINGVQVAGVHDSIYAQGILQISATGPAPIEARFANLIVTRP